jgi:predicted Rossmann fold flavoprotein
LYINHSEIHTDLLVVGAGAAGFFAAIHAKTAKPNKQVLIIEKSNKVLAKVLVSGGGRCNVTHNQTDLGEILECYPRGRTLLKWTLRKWGVTNTIRWFERHGVPLKTEEDGRMFPTTDNSETIVSCLTEEATRLGVSWKLGMGMKSFEPLSPKGFKVLTDKGDTIITQSLLIACGGFPKAQQFEFITRHGITIVEPVPSLFTFNIPNDALRTFMGVSVPWGRIKVIGMDEGPEKGWFSGPILITHWGLSGPAILKASAFLARELAKTDYQASVLVDWTGMGEEKARSLFDADLLMNAAKMVDNINPFQLPKRLWEYLLQLSSIDGETRVRDMAKSAKNKLLENCIRCAYNMEGKTTFKEEFVTAGGVATTAVDKDSLECKQLPGLFFAGEILDIDGITGGFNFQAAWSTGYLAGVRAIEKA